MDISNNIEQTDYITFDDFVKEYFDEKQILMDDLNGINDRQFYDKYKIMKNMLHQECVEQYQQRYPEDYNKHLENHRIREQKRIDDYNEKRRQAIEKRKDELAEILMRQTDYTKEQAMQELESVDFNVSLAVKKYMNPENTTIPDQIDPTTTNQKIYKEIRDFMDKGSMDYERRKEYSRRMIEYQKQLQEQQQNETNTE